MYRHLDHPCVANQTVNLADNWPVGYAIWRETALGAGPNFQASNNNKDIAYCHKPQQDMALGSNLHLL